MHAQVFVNFNTGSMGSIVINHGFLVDRISRVVTMALIAAIFCARSIVKCVAGVGEGFITVVSWHESTAKHRWYNILRSCVIFASGALSSYIKINGLRVLRPAQLYASEIQPLHNRAAMSSIANSCNQDVNIILVALTLVCLDSTTYRTLLAIHENKGRSLTKGIGLQYKANNFMDTSKIAHQIYLLGMGSKHDEEERRVIYIATDK
ncbi:hypothetical protein DFH05DRAFT_1456477 [Lentinula detonsa]|uniref:Uncharacterized protein n=1 Tax=Lentinula detonsa TaxID=2804962 RepID=A0A9W8P7A6_9AGAR|nr:hypothetical protein DFH05DRAFT_1456477 [Lentinula detonsa]